MNPWNLDKTVNGNKIESAVLKMVVKKNARKFSIIAEDVILMLYEQQIYVKFFEFFITYEYKDILAIYFYWIFFIQWCTNFHTLLVQQKNNVCLRILTWNHLSIRTWVIYFPHLCQFPLMCISRWTPNYTNLKVKLRVIFIWTQEGLSLAQDKYDDATIGIKSTALRLGEATPRWLAGFGTAMVTGLLAVGFNADQTWPYYLTVALVSGHLARQVSRGCREVCRKCSPICMHQPSETSVHTNIFLKEACRLHY